MGIRGLFNLISKKCPSARSDVPISTFKGHTIYIDSSVLMYRFETMSSHFNKTTGLIEQKRCELGNRTGFLLGFSSFIKNYERIGLKPVFVFDGKFNQLKEKEVLLKESKKI